MYIERFIHDADKSKLHDFLLSEKLTENLVYGYAEQDIVYRRIESEKSYIKMRAKKYVDIKDNIAMITLHNVKRTYKMDVYVVENAGTLAIDKIIVNKTKDDNNGSATGKVDIGGDVNGNGFNFVNTYVQEAGTGTDPTNPGTDPDDDYTKYGSLNVSKTIDAQAGTVDSDAEFTFTAKFEFPKGTDAETLEAKAGDATLTLDENNQHTFTLKHGQNMKYTGLPVGTKITVTETGVANYKGSVSVVLNGGTATTDTAAKYHADFEAVKDGKLGQQKNTVDVTNTYNYVPTTGIIMNTLP